MLHLKAALLAATLVLSGPGLLIGEQPKETVRTQRTGELSLAQLTAKYPRLFFLRGDPAKRQIALTFDDAPDPRFTPQILDVLKARGVKATFFVVGSRAEKHPDLVRRMIREGHVVGGHSYDHPDLTRLSDARFHAQIERTSSILTELTGNRPNLVRPPYGEIRERQLLWLGRHGYYTVNWSADSLDWRNLPSDRVYANVMKSIRPGVIVLQHAGGGAGERLGGTIRALPRIIDELNARSYRLVTVPELLDLPGTTEMPDWE
ncbi:polysaccharide deacetylase family protein [Gorillibacterium sp. sgz500922]|uniref:polysaccharide deacetylase family protein n=1 Tax=Gorillibacterium sp. sgz500922 TaxID=3446694 RepID=UPI003F666A4A